MDLKVSSLIEDFGFTPVTGDIGLDAVVTGVYIGDMLSWVMGRAPEESVWITICGHVNIVAVALLTGVSCIIVSEGAEVTKETIDKAIDEEIPILTTSLTSYEAACLFYERS